MSHFTVCVRISAETIAAHGGNTETALGALLAPYQENNMSDCPKEFLALNDETDDVDTEWDELDDEDRGKYASKARYAKEYHGYDEHEGKFGYWEKPNAKWDWWVLGGRWRGFIPVKPTVVPVVGRPGTFDNAAKPGHSDIVSIDQVDFDAIVSGMHERADKFWDEWLQLIRGKKFHAFEGPRSQAINIGLLVVRKGAPLPGEESRAMPWAGVVPPQDSRSAWHDVWSDVSKADFMRDHIEAFNPIKTYATLDEMGWHEPGRMGWFGCSSATPETTKAHAASFISWVRDTPADARLAIVDCHI